MPAAKCQPSELRRRFERTGYPLFEQASLRRTMTVFRDNPASRSRGVLIACALALASSMLPTQAGAGELVAQTKLRVTVLQWMPMKGAYEQWPALGGEFVVSDDGTIVLPVIGTIEIGDMDATKLAADIAKRIQAKTGLVDKPDTTVAILEYPPVYVVGDVAKPGEYKYRDGLTVLQALALSGGEWRGTLGSGKNEIGLVGELRGFEAQILRSTARIARLRAEASGAETIESPAVPPGTESGLADDIFNQERTIFTTRAKELTRQTKSLSDLQELFTAEIGTLEQKTATADAGIAAAERDLNAVKGLVSKGFAVMSRQSELERVVASYRGERLDQVTAIMRARQNLAEAKRNMEGIEDKRQTEVASDIQAEQANLEQLRLKRDVSQKLLLDTLSSSGSATGVQEASISYSITRSQGGQKLTMPAVESTTLMPGDVVKVTSPLAALQGGQATPEAAAAETATTGEASQ
jgi:polysaccharide export outer membrane protein